jgi:hypothetical protein
MTWLTLRLRGRVRLRLLLGLGLVFGIDYEVDIILQELAACLELKRKVCVHRRLPRPPRLLLLHLRRPPS